MLEGLRARFRGLWGGGGRGVGEEEEEEEEGESEVEDEEQSLRGNDHDHAHAQQHRTAEQRSAVPFSEARITWYRKMFDLHDRKGHGELNVKQLEMLLRDMQEPAWLAEQMLEYFDADGSGTCSFEEFLEIMTFAYFERHEDIMDAFEVFDQNRDGVLDFGEWRYIVCELGDGLSHEEAREVFSMLDFDSNGEISLQEFSDFLEQVVLPIAKSRRRRVSSDPASASQQHPHPSSSSAPPQAQPSSSSRPQPHQPDPNDHAEIT